MQEKGTAVVIIHGIGQQNPFETLDSFGRGLATHLGAKLKHIEHVLAPFSNNKGEKYIDSFIRLHLSEKMGEATFIDIHEYYWANLTERQITTAEIGEWISTTLKGAKNAFKHTPELNSIVANQKKDYWYKLTDLLYKGMLIYRLLRFINFLIPKWLTGLKNFIQQQSEYILIGYVGDIAIYTGMDVKSKNFNVRSSILKGSVNLLKEIISNEHYQKVIVAGHSLGSVIAYDTLNKIQTEATLKENVKQNAKKIGGLLTFGSPLDKIYFFFNERTSKEQYIRGQITENLHSFRIHNRSNWPFGIKNPITPFIDENIVWLNLYHSNDPVSGRLDFYTVNENIKCIFRNKYDKWGIAHVGYWEHKGLYTNLEKLL
ncbi:hypothetical protein FLAV_01861 [Flavobacteriales bacterium]|nr:hypothetical protein [Flavobacteriales bacterium]MCL4816991.1 hypothetical protein [Flavobacteriales bacterium]WKZ74388.1 MAG: hypothetical protein QY303_09560 [Vicingaceae bacterium]GIK70571.1 MAG: hypothetical protein BroJett020_18660 [Bacteroidota bacterium]CAG0982815.1 hypothetical protein FLAV_01861 [Flavobacteriales bacterium]